MYDTHKTIDIHNWKSSGDTGFRHLC